jgi:hypothetical protein
MPTSKSKDLPVVGVAELGYMLDLTRARISQIVREPDFPRGIELRMGKVWWFEDITAWANAKDRTLRPIPATWPAVPAGATAGRTWSAAKGAPVSAGRYKKR